MKNSRLYIGNIMYCTDIDINHITLYPGGAVTASKPSSKVYKEGAVLVKTRHGYYLDVEQLRILDILYLYLEHKKYISTWSPYMMGHLLGSYLGEYYVQEDSKANTPKLLEEQNMHGHTSLLKIRNQLRKRHE